MKVWRKEEQAVTDMKFGLEFHGEHQDVYWLLVLICLLAWMASKPIDQSLI